MPDAEFLFGQSAGNKIRYSTYADGKSDWVADPNGETYETDTIISFIEGDPWHLVWTNNDIPHDAGALYLKASEPIPVYE